MRQTPYYVFDTDEFAKRAAMIRAALDCKGGRRIPLCFSIKANPFLLHRLPEGLDHVEVCSPGELEICIALGVKPESIIYSGVMKEKCDIERAVSYGAGILTCESIRHAALISEVMLERMPEGAHEAGLVGQCLGAGRKDEAIYYIKKLTAVAEIVIIASCALVFLATKPVTILGGMEPESAKMCLYMVGWITVVKPIVWTLAFIPAYGMRAAGDVRFSMILSCISMWAFRVTLCIYLCRVHGFGPIAVWIGMFTDWTIRGIVFTFRFMGRRWLAHKVV